MRKLAGILVATVLLILVAAFAVLYRAHERYDSSGDTRYEIALSADGTRAAVEKLKPGSAVEVFEGPIGGPWTAVRAPADSRLAALGLAYAPDGPTLLYSTVPDREGRGPYTLWRQPLPGGEPTPLLEHAGAFANVLPLRNGGVAFMGEVNVVERTGWSPNPRASDRWYEFRWMLWQPSGGVRTLTTKSRLLTGPATLVRDELLLFVDQVMPEYGQQAQARRYALQTVSVGEAAHAPPEAATIASEALDAPRLDCSWSGATCVRLVTYNKGYYAHKAEMVRGTDICALDGLPDRIERHRIAADGTAVLVLARQNPDSDELALIHLVFDKTGCGTRHRSRLALPLHGRVE